MRTTIYQQVREIVLFEDPEILDFYENNDVIFENFITDIYGPASCSVLSPIHNTNQC
jgi:hypothetical protein